MAQHKDMKSVDKMLEEKLSRQPQPESMLEKLKKAAQANKIKRF